MPYVQEGHETSGTTAARPTNAEAGFRYYDTDLKALIVWNGTEWQSSPRAVAVTATTGGGTIGLIPAGAKHVTITSDTATKQVSLPAAVVGHKMTLFIGDTGCELISAVAAHEVNNVVVGATNELALPANTSYHCEYVATNKWIVRGFTNLGADAAALVPNAL